MKILIDLDGCAYNYVEAFAECVSERRKQPLAELESPTSWNFYKDNAGWNMTTAEFLEHMRHAIRRQDLFLRGHPYPGARQALRSLWEHELIVVSSRIYGRDTERHAWEQTLTWLDRHHFPYFDEILLIDSTVKKSDLCHDLGITVAIEDSIDNHRALLDAGVESYLLTRPWNAGGIVDVANRITSWHEFTMRLGVVSAMPNPIHRSQCQMGQSDGEGGLKDCSCDAGYIRAEIGWRLDDSHPGTPIIDDGTGTPLEIRVVDPNTGGEKGQKLARFDLIPVDVEELLAEHYGRGALKYADRNWERGYAWSLSYAALRRHLAAFWKGEEIDTETGSLHIIAVLWHAAALTAFYNRGVGTDDRPK